MADVKLIFDLSYGEKEAYGGSQNGERGKPGSQQELWLSQHWSPRLTSGLWLLPLFATSLASASTLAHDVMPITQPPHT